MLATSGAMLVPMELHLEPPEATLAVKHMGAIARVDATIQVCDNDIMSLEQQEVRRCRVRSLGDAHWVDFVPGTSFQTH